MEYDAVIGRWTAINTKRQFFSPYAISHPGFLILVTGPNIINPFGLSCERNFLNR